MTTIGDATAAAANANGPDKDPKHVGLAALKPEDFLKLLIEQLKHQNPSSPTDSNAMLQQMSQISQINASQDMQKAMKDLSTNMNITMANTQVLEATQLIGKHVQVAKAFSPLSQVEGSSPPVMNLEGSVMAPGPATSVKVSILDTSGHVLQTIDLGPASRRGLMDFKWNGVTKDGKVMPPDMYTLSATATADGKTVAAETAGAFKVKSVGMGPSGVALNVEGLGGMDMGDIVKIL